MSERSAVQTEIPTKSTFTPPTSCLMQRACACGQHTGGSSECEACKKKGDGKLQRVAVNDVLTQEVPPIVHEVLRSPGQPLDMPTRAFMELRFGHDFSGVRVHTDSKSAESAQVVNALAYTIGRDIFFASGQYNPETLAGRWTLAHELTHVIQQDSQDFGPGRVIAVDTPDYYEQQANAAASTVEGPFGLAPVSAINRRGEPAIMLLTPAQFRGQLGATPEQRSAIDVLFANPTFRALWDYLGACNTTPPQDLGPLALRVTPGLTIGGVERFGGYNPFTRTLEINPTKPEHRSNPTELVDTVVHELIHAVDDLQADCVATGSAPAPLGGAATTTAPSRASVAGTPAETTLMTELGPGASNPCEEFIDINATAQQMIIQILTQNIELSRVGRPTVTFVNEILRRDPAAMSEYEACRDSACTRPTAAERRREVARCSAEIIGKFTPTDLLPALLPTRVSFNFDSHTLQPDSLETLDLVALFLMAHPGTSVELVGHTDSVGPETYNLDLGRLRAESVAQELLRKGVDPRQILSVTSQGEAVRLSTGPATRWKDRRVEIIPSSTLRIP